MSAFIAVGTALGELVLYDDRMRSASKTKCFDRPLTHLLAGGGVVHAASDEGAVARLTVEPKPAVTSKRMIEHNSIVGLCWATADGERVLAVLDGRGALRALDPSSLETVTVVPLGRNKHDNSAPIACAATGAGIVYVSDEGHVRALDLELGKIRHAYIPTRAPAVAIVALGTDRAAVLDSKGELSIYDVHRPDEEPLRFAMQAGRTLCAFDARTALVGGDGLALCDGLSARMVAGAKDHVTQIAHAKGAVAAATAASIRVILVTPEGAASPLATAKPDAETTALVFLEDERTS